MAKFSSIRRYRKYLFNERVWYRIRSHGQKLTANIRLVKKIRRGGLKSAAEGSESTNATSLNSLNL